MKPKQYGSYFQILSNLCHIFEPLLLNSCHLLLLNSCLTFKASSIPPNITSKVFSSFVSLCCIVCLRLFKIVSHICSVLSPFVCVCVKVREASDTKHPICCLSYIADHKFSCGTVLSFFWFRESNYCLLNDLAHTFLFS